MDRPLQAEAERPCDSLKLDTFALLTTIENELFSAGLEEEQANLHQDFWLPQLGPQAAAR
jgi:hypothetical protein